MTVRECYAEFHGNYGEALGRLMKEERIAKYLRMFAADPSCLTLETELNEKRFEDAFRTVHNMKGMALNLSLTPLAEASSVLCEAIRHGDPGTDVSGMLRDVKESYELAVSAIRKLD